MSRKQTTKCGKCGFCLSVCPVYSVLSEEQSSPRARVQLIKNYEEGRLKTSPLLKEIISKCLMCGSCSASCPSEVDHYSQFIRMRSAMVEDHGDRVEIKSLVYLLAREQRLALAASVARLGQGFVPDRFVRKYKLANIPINRFPALNRKPFRTSVAEEHSVPGRSRGTVLYFTGCATNYIYDETGYSTVCLLKKMGYQVIIPAKQTCCSIPMLFHGAEERAKSNILQNIECFNAEEAEAIIVDCPTCGSALKNEYPAMVRRYGLNPYRAEAISGKVIDIMSFVYDRRDQLEIDPALSEKQGGLTYHTPCHLKNCFDPADRLLRELDGIEYLPAADSQECCGGGGTFFYEYPDVSRVLAERKVDNAKKTGAALWLTDCPVCRINLSGQLADEDSIVMSHPVQFLEKILR
ncbi:(Fe-S)-binding protein [Desulfopila sp. IMCC35008]|uniref:(Fe-S)-binding protein n=1 Tax=Desulfopila sp. IMCC35008 TaxID=2653858 RepID=UPI0013D6B131|nr:(Fe-S)-binding protein [Desulfopila sp. IMCC35008]